MKNKFKSGAASFYIVAFSTLILVIIAASFASAIISEVTRSSNDDLSQSAYDAALAGAEDAKLAFYNYYNCIKNGANPEPASLSDSQDVTCQDIVYWMNHPEVENGGCDMVANILGRFSKSATEEERKNGVPVEEGEENDMDQAYTCTIIKTDPNDYAATLSTAEPYRVISPNFKDNKKASDVAYVELSWYLIDETSKFNYKNIVSNEVIFPTNAEVTTPPVVALQLIQTANSYNLQQLTGKKDGEKTDRGAAYFVPTNSKSIAGGNGDSYYGLYGNKTIFTGAGQRTGNMNLLSAAQLASTNDHSKDLPYTTYCSTDGEYGCSVMIKLPEAVGGGEGNRNDSTFSLVVSLPYGQPETEFSLLFYDKFGNSLKLDKTQIMIDSTGRANDLYRRVEVRMEPADSSLEYPFYALQLGDGGGEALSKTLKVTSECYQYSGSACGNESAYSNYNY